MIIKTGIKIINPNDANIISKIDFMYFEYIIGFNINLFYFDKTHLMHSKLFHLNILFAQFFLHYHQVYLIFP